MPPLGIIAGVAMIAGGIAAEAAAVTMIATLSAVMTVAGGLLTVAMSIVSMTSGSPETPPEQAIGTQVNSCEPMKSIPLIYGKQKVGVNRIFMASDGSDNKMLHIIGIIGEGEINGIYRDYFYVDGTPTVDQYDQIFLDDEPYTKFGANVTYEFFPGYSDDTNLCNTLVGVDGWNDPLHNTAYIYLKLEYDRDKFQSVPQITLIVEGLKILDTRTSVTGYSNNPALCAYDYITRNRNRGGMGIDASRILTTSVNDAATYCESDGWTCNLIINENKSAIDILNDILLTFRGDLVYSQCQFKLLYRDLDDEASVMSLDDGDIVETADKSSLNIVQDSIFETPNAIKINYPNIDNKYVADSYIFVDSSALSIDGDYREKQVTLSGTVETANVIKMGNYFLERERINKKVSFVANSRCMSLEPHDLITLSHTFPGWTDKLLRVTKTAILQNGEVAISAVEESSVFYNDTYDMATHTFHDTTLPDPAATIPNVINVTTEEEQYFYGNRTFTRLKVNFDPPATTDYPWWSSAEIWVSIDGGNNWKNIGTATSDIQLDPVEEGITYQVKIQGVNIWGGKEALDNCYSIAYLVTGETSAPATPDPITVLASGDVVTILTEEITDPDVEGYEIRLGDSWDGGIYIGTYKGATIRLAGFKPGTYTFWLSPKSNRGYYAATKRSGQVTVLYPANYKNFSTANGWLVNTGTWTWDFASTGTYSNSTNSTYSSTNVMNASHSSVTGFVNLNFSSGVTGWSTYLCNASTYNSSGIDGVEITCTDIDAGFYQATTSYPKNSRIDIHFTYKNASGSTARLRMYGSATALLGPTKLPNTTVWSTYSTYVTGSWSDTALQIALKPATGSTGQVIYAANITMSPTSVLSGKWLSPIYDLGDKYKARIWGDFVYNFAGSNQYWPSVPSSWTWAEVGSSSKRWYELTPITQAGQINAKLIYGDSSDVLNSTIEYFQITSPEIYGRYLQVEVEIVDPDAGSNLYLHNLNMNAAYWTTANT